MTKLSTQIDNFDIITNLHNEICSKAEALFGVDMTNVTLTFDLKGKSAGQAFRKTDKIGIRYNSEACIKHLDHMKSTVPHEIAHIVCFLCPDLGKNHNAGWKQVCIALGGTGERCHSLELTPTRKLKRFEYNVVSACGSHTETMVLGPKYHKNIQLGLRKYWTKSTNTSILPEHFNKQV